MSPLIQKGDRSGRDIFWADEQSFVARSLASVDRTHKHKESSAIPPSALLYREQSLYID
jgi:hypothetical protein